MSAKSLNQKHLPLPIDPKAVEILIDAYGKKELLFNRQPEYCGQPAKPGFVFYWIYYETAGKVVYSGAYQISKYDEDRLKENEQLGLFLIVELSKQLV